VKLAVVISGSIQPFLGQAIIIATNERTNFEMS
jgi:hypothetical protein